MRSLVYHSSIIIFLSTMILGTVRYSPCQTIKTLSLEFEREYAGRDKKEKLNGKLFYQAPSRTYVRIANPVNQWVIYEKNEMTIFYPEENNVFHIVFQFPVTLNFFQAFIRTIYEDFGLPELGFTLLTYEKKGNRLISVWSPPKGISKAFGEFSIEYMNNRLVYSEIKNKKGEIISKSFYEGHFCYGSYFFPQQISTIYYSNSNSNLEVVKFKNPTFNCSLPDEVINFRIPQGAKVKEIKW